MCSLPSPSKTATEEKRDNLITWMQIALALAGGLLCAFSSWMLLSVAPSFAKSLIRALSAQIPFSKTIATLLGEEFAQNLVGIVVSFLGGGWLVWKARNFIESSAKYLFPTFDTELFHPIKRPGSLDPLWLPPIGSDRGMQPLPWIAPPPNSSRFAVWSALVMFLSKDVGDGRFNLLLQPTTPFVRLRWIMLVGQPGSGKTRMATEIARARARRELIGSDRADLRAKRRRLVCRAWLRHVWPASRRREVINLKR